MHNYNVYEAHKQHQLFTPHNSNSDKQFKKKTTVLNKTLVNHWISLTLDAGDSISITGNNGVGKSTLISLLSGFLHPNTGKIKLDGRDIFDYEFEFLRAHIGIVPQHGLLFEGTILENMTLYREGSAIDQAIELSKILGLDEIITRLPSGLDTQVGGAAVDSLSVGVRQKIIMVRSLVGHPKIMLFDDANANFDIKNDARLHKVVEEYKKDKTLVIVSHRPSFLKLCNRHFKLQNKKLVETTNQTFNQKNNHAASV